MLARILSLVVALKLCCATTLPAAEPSKTPRQWLDHFSRHWQEGDWKQKGRFSPAGYMRPLEDDGWQARMRAMQGCAKYPDSSIPVLLTKLRTGDAPERILAAQALGYLGSGVPSEPLVAALKSDANPAVRLYLVDTLGMIGKTTDVDWKEFVNGESNRDVKRHVSYLQQRAGKPLDPRVVDQLKQWDSRHINTAKIGRPAPDFALSSAQGDSVQLSDFRGKKNVVLVFIYGDT
jgi:hypothetical protein